MWVIPKKYLLLATKLKLVEKKLINHIPTENKNYTFGYGISNPLSNPSPYLNLTKNRLKGISNPFIKLVSNQGENREPNPSSNQIHNGHTFTRI